MKKDLKIILLVWLIAIFVLPQIVLADNAALEKLQNVGTGESGAYTSVTEQTGLTDFIAVAIQAGLALIGVIFLALMLYAGYNWMIARGEEEKVTKAKDTITRAIIGLIIVVGAYAIYNFIFTNFISK